MTAGLFRRIERQVLHQQRPRADEAHIAAQYVPQLGQLVQARAAKEAAEGRQPFGVGQQIAVGPAQVAHGAKFEEGEGLAGPTWPRLAE
ncbi:MAG: hypothetical protein BWY63_00932 [Chloroflexi bacterium ADurb.Bin360]|nr:MAG: hypothetical protein BWY63_00932 [Chloroflexi bacterium ADurb.Bin360]